MGKSNTAKIIIARTFAISERQRRAAGRPIGQLIFDPQGEYANPNTQDGTEIAAIGATHVSIYKFGADGRQAHVKPLNINFFAENQIDAVQGLISDTLSDDEAGYIKDFAGASYSDDPVNPHNPHPGRARLVLYAALKRAGFALPNTYSVRINMAGALQRAVIGVVGHNPFNGQANRVAVSGADLETVVDAIIQLREGGDQDARNFSSDVRWQSVEPIFTTRSGNRNVRGWRNLNPLRPFHSPVTQQDPALEIYAELVDGRIVIVDLHVGAEAITKPRSV